MSRLFEYFIKIKMGKTINYSAFKKLCEYHRLSDWENVFSFIHLGKQKYHVTVLDEVQFQRWCELYSNQDNTRIQAAKAGDSHREKAGVSFLLRHNQQSGTPEVLWLAAGKACPRNISHSAVIMENLENFYHLTAMQTVLAQWLPETANIGADWLFGSGNQISNSLNHNYLSQYPIIYCLFDWDVGGIQIFRNLKKMLPEHDILFALPENPQHLLMQSNRRLALSAENKLVELRGISGETDCLITAMLASRRQLEQEIYLLEE